MTCDAVELGAVQVHVLALVAAVFDGGKHEAAESETVESDANTVQGGGACGCEVCSWGV